MSASGKLMKYITTPSKIANALDWKKMSGSVLSLNVERNNIRLALASHPAFGEPVESLEPIPLELETKGAKKVLSQHVVDDLQDIVKQNKVCGFVVCWPVQKEGRLGAPCGKVLHTLDALCESSSLLSSSRPFCLWDGQHIKPAPEDEWGRSPIYGRRCTRTTEHRASQEQYLPSEKCNASETWRDFCDVHWPELKEEENDLGEASSSSKFSDLLAEYEDDGAYMKQAVL